MFLETSNVVHLDIADNCISSNSKTKERSSSVRTEFRAFIWYVIELVFVDIHLLVILVQDANTSASDTDGSVNLIELRALLCSSIFLCSSKLECVLSVHIMYINIRMFI